MQYDCALSLLHRYEHDPGKWEAVDYVGHGNSGCAYRVRLDDQTFLVKIFDHYNPELVASRLQGIHKALRYNSFLVECRAYGQVAREGRNGHFLAHCHGWIEIPQHITRKIARDLAHRGRFLEQPPTVNGRLRGILFDYIEGEDLGERSLDAKYIKKIETCVTALHDCGITHGDLNRSNIRLTKEDRVFLLDLGSSITFPHPSFREGKREQEEMMRRNIDWSDLSRLTGDDLDDGELSKLRMTRA